MAKVQMGTFTMETINDVYLRTYKFVCIIFAYRFLNHGIPEKAFVARKGIYYSSKKRLDYNL